MRAAGDARGRRRCRRRRGPGAALPRRRRPERAAASRTHRRCVRRLRCPGRRCTSTPGVGGLAARRRRVRTWQSTLRTARRAPPPMKGAGSANEWATIRTPCSIAASISCAAPGKWLMNPTPIGRSVRLPRTFDLVDATTTAPPIEVPPISAETTGLGHAGGERARAHAAAHRRIQDRMLDSEQLARRRVWSTHATLTVVGFLRHPTPDSGAWCRKNLGQRGWSVGSGSSSSACALRSIAARCAFSASARCCSAANCSRRARAARSSASAVRRLLSRVAGSGHRRGFPRLSPRVLPRGGDSPGAPARPRARRAEWQRRRWRQ